MTEWKQESWNERSRNFTWFYRFIFFALPYFVLDAFFQVLNLYFNTFAHHMWGNGNVILIFNTLVSLVQGLTSFLLVAEEPTYMSMLKPVRRFSFAMAACYNIFYLWGGSEFLVSYQQARDEQKEYSFLRLLVDMFFVINLAFYAPIMMMNFVILGKEFSFEFMPGHRKIYFGGSHEDLKLGLGNIWSGFSMVLNMFNPFWWIKLFIADENSEAEDAKAYLDSLTDAQKKKEGL